MSEKLKAEILKDAQKQPFCQHYKINPKGTRPYDKRTRIQIDDLTDKLIAEVSAETRLPKECVMCVCAMRLVKLIKGVKA